MLERLNCIPSITVGEKTCHCEAFFAAAISWCCVRGLLRRKKRSSRWQDVALPSFIEQILIEGEIL